MVAPSSEARDIAAYDDYDEHDARDQPMSEEIANNDVPASNAQSINATSQNNQRSSESGPETLLAYYQRLLPWRFLFQWLNHSAKPSTDFSHREFAFTLQNDAYLRYQSFLNFESLRKEVLRLNPSRFEIGPVYSANPRDRKTLRKAAFRPVEKELVFDIDLTDYDDIRTCCSGADICLKCWQFAIMAIKVLNSALQDDFNFQHILWVYSGRRGVHAWVCDKRARTMDDSKRRAIASYFEVLKGGSQSGKRVNIKRPLHPHLNRSLEILKVSFVEDILESQDPWGPTEKAEKLLKLLPDKELNEALKQKWELVANRPSKSKWDDIDAVAKTGVSGLLNSKTLMEAKQDILLEYTYPRLDAEVSKHLNHLLKSPFCVHPGTGRVCVPIDPSKLDEFDPSKVPTVAELLQELNDGAREPDLQTPAAQDYEKTKLKSYIEFFKSFVNRLVSDELKTKEVSQILKTD